MKKWFCVLSVVVACAIPTVSCTEQQRKNLSDTKGDITTELVDAGKDAAVSAANGDWVDAAERLGSALAFVIVAVWGGKAGVQAIRKRRNGTETESL